MFSFLIGFSVFLVLLIAGMVLVVLGLVALDRLERSLHGLVLHARSFAISHHLIVDHR
jgi:hypothetical protein